MTFKQLSYLESRFPCTEKNMFDHHISSSCVCWVASLGKKHNFIAPKDCKHRNGLWFCAMDLHHAHGHDFHPKARQKLCRLSCSKHTEESQVAPGYRCFFRFWGYLWVSHVQQKDSTINWPSTCILFGIAQPRNWFFALSVSGSKNVMKIFITQMIQWRKVTTNVCSEKVDWK